MTKFEDNLALPPFESLEALIIPITKAMMISNHGNPTGYLYREEEIQKLDQLIEKHYDYLIAENVYRQFTYDGHKHYSILTQADIAEIAIVIDSVSKRYSMCGARIGCVVSKNQEFMATVMKFAQARLSPPTYAQIASEAALDTPQSYFDEVQAEYLQRRNTLVNALQQIEGVKVASPKGAFYCIAQL